MVQALWVEKWRPTTVNDYVFRDERLKNQVLNWIKEKTLPHTLFSGGAGVGKSTLAGILIKALDIDPGDILYVNASEETGVQFMRDQIINFVSTVSLGDMKVVLLEECDHLSRNSQAALRRVMEDYADCCRFILTCNYVHKMLPAIRSRCQEIAISQLDEDAFKERIINILIQEEVELDEEAIDSLDTYIKASYPDMRKCINTIQLNVQGNRLLSPLSNEAQSADWQLQAVELFKQGKISEGRKLVVEGINTEEFEDFYKLCYKNLDWWSKDPLIQDEAVLLIKQGLVDHTICADSEINLAATLIQLGRLGK